MIQSERKKIITAAPDWILSSFALFALHHMELRVLDEREDHDDDERSLNTPKDRKKWKEMMLI